MAWQPGKPQKIYVISAAGGNPQAAMTEERSEADPTWSPDGNSLAFGRLPFQEFGSYDSIAISVLDLRNRQVSRLPGSEELYSPRWSLDGRYLAAMPDDSSKLMLFDFTTKKWVELAKGNFGFPNWSRDGYLYFEDWSQGAAIRRVRIRDQRFETVAGLKGLSRPNPTSGFWSAPAYDGSPLVMRDAGIQEIYAFDLRLPDFRLLHRQTTRHSLSCNDEYAKRQYETANSLRGTRSIPATLSQC
jgi:WD40-like Beta Propeller Repeat